MRLFIFSEKFPEDPAHYVVFENDLESAARAFINSYCAVGRQSNLINFYFDYGDNTNIALFFQVDYFRIGKQTSYEVLVSEYSIEQGKVIEVF